MEYIAQYKTVKQVSPDDWELTRPALKINDYTTIGEVRKWIEKNERYAPGRVWKMHIEILQLDHIEQQQP